MLVQTWVFIQEKVFRGNKLAANLHIKSSLDVLCPTSPTQEFLKRYRQQKAEMRMRIILNIMKYRNTNTKRHKTDVLSKLM